jgi:MYXO-CTERM domain-containing protein
MAPRVLRLAVWLLSVSCLVACSDNDGAEPVAQQKAELKALGVTCGAGTECDSGFCVDGVCCGTACNGTCVACEASLKQSLADSGTCGAALEGLDPHDSCAADTPGGCGQTGACDGKGACAKVPQGVACGADAGAGNVCVIQSAKGPICSGNGTCYNETSPSGVPCAPYQCKNGSCAFPCSGDGDCQATNRCENGVCKPKRQNGQACTTLGQCASGNCTDGVCCDSNCGGQCQACNLPGKLGTCSFVVGTPVSPRPDCSGTGACKGTCAGNGDKCSYPNTATECGPASCTGDVSTAAATCDGTGSCAAGSTAPCSPYGCDATTGVCRKSCTGDGDCAQGGLCDTTTGKCAVATATCLDATTVKLPNGQSQSCEPYKCKAGKCQQQCSTQSDCADGFLCQGASCVVAADAATGGTGGGGGSSGGGGASGSSAGGSAPTGGSKSSGDSSDSGGCGCRVAASPRPESGWLALMALFALGFGRKRRATSIARRLRTGPADHSNLR